MLDKKEITRCLLDSDGTTRDVTFTPVTAENLRAFLNSLLRDYQISMARDADAKDIASLFKDGMGDDVFRAPEGYMHVVLERPEQLIPVLQVFIDWPMDHRGYGIELSFFPNDLGPKTFRVEAFMALMEKWCSLIGAEDYFVRYENASWEWYDSSGLGVIYTGSQLRASQSI